MSKVLKGVDINISDEVLREYPNLCSLIRGHQYDIYGRAPESSHSLHLRYGHRDLIVYLDSSSIENMAEENLMYCRYPKLEVEKHLGDFLVAISKGFNYLLPLEEFIDPYDNITFYIIECGKIFFLVFSHGVLVKSSLANEDHQFNSLEDSLSYLSRGVPCFEDDDL